MTVLGLHIIDLLIVVIYLFAMMYIGKAVSKNIKGQTDFFLAGRKLGKIIQFFLNFGMMTDANGAAAISSFVFKSGIGGIWFGLQTLFLTPYYWFMNPWFRRVRLITMAELFEDRFGGKSISTLYAIFGIGLSTLVVGSGYLISGRIMEPMMIKPMAEYTQKDILLLQQYEEYTNLKVLYNEGKLPVESRDKYETLSSLKEKGQIRPYATYLNENWFYILYALVVGFYVVLGGFEAAALTDAIQGILIIVFSFILIPFGLAKVGGFSGLHDKVPSAMFSMFGDISTGEFTWFSVLAILLVSWVAIHGGIGNMAVGGSAKDEMAARIGAVTGGFCKRFMLIAWGLCGLLAYALYKNTITNPDTTWGVLTKGLLGPGTMGLMIAGILAANMSTLSSVSMHISALFVRNIYEPFRPKKTEKEYVLAGRVAIIAVLLAGIFIAKYSQSVLSLLKFMLGTGVTVGAPVVLVFFWRRLTKTAVVTEILICMLVLFILPLCLPFVGIINSNPSLMTYTNQRVIGKTYAASEIDVEQGLAANIGDNLTKSVLLPPVSIFFDAVTYSDPYNLNSQLVGKGNFRIELYILSRLGMDFKDYSPAGLLTATYVFDSILPFVILFAVSLFTKRTDEAILKRFYAKMLTPVHSDPDIDSKEMSMTLQDPHRFDDTKILPNSDWEFKKWNRIDFFGFMICWIGVLIVLGVLWLVTNIGS